MITNAQILVRPRADDEHPGYSPSFLACRGICPCCLTEQSCIETVPQGTAYTDDNANFFTGCPECIERNAEYWEERWAEYRSSQGFYP